MDLGWVILVVFLGLAFFFAWRGEIALKDIDDKYVERMTERLKEKEANQVVCPECHQGKHGNCDGIANMDDDGNFVLCKCNFKAHVEQTNNKGN